jgi:uncharacterized membrane-anchored protein
MSKRICGEVFRFRGCALLLSLAASALQPLAAQEITDDELAAVWQAVADSHVAGPAQVQLADQAIVDIAVDRSSCRVRRPTVS